jgi:hypothetical protein
MAMDTKSVHLPYVPEYRCFSTYYSHGDGCSRTNNCAPSNAPACDALYDLQDYRLTEAYLLR